MTLSPTAIQSGFDAVAARYLRLADLLDVAAADAPPSAAVVTGLGASGWTGSAVAEAHGGLGLAGHDLADLSEVVGARLVPAALREEAMLLAPCLEVAVDNGFAWAVEMLAGLLNGSVRGGGAAVLEPAAAVLVEVAGGYELSMTRVPAWLVPGGRLLAVRAPDWVAMLDVERAGVHVTKPRALDAAQGQHLVSMNGLRLDEAAVAVGAAAAALLHRHRIALLAETLGVAGEVLSRSVEYARSREQFGRPIGSFQAVAHLLADAKATVETAWSGLARLLALTPGSWVPDPAAELLALALAQAIPAGCRVVCETGIQVHGGTGFTWEYGLHLHYRRALHLQVVLGGARGSAVSVGTRYLEERRRQHG